MRSREEFKALVYSKRDRLLEEELIQKEKLNKKKSTYAILSSVAAACVVALIVLPNMGKFSGPNHPPMESNLPSASDPGDPELGGADNGDMVPPGQAPVSTGAPSSVADIPVSTRPPVEYPAEVPSSTEPTVNVPAETDPPADLPTDMPPVCDERLQVKFTSTLSTEPGGYVSMTGDVIGKLEGEIGDEILMITDYETLRSTYERLCPDRQAISIFGEEIFDEDRVVFVIERIGGDTGNNEVVYSYNKFENGTLHMTREYTYNGQYDVLCVEVRCVDFVVVNKYGFDLSQIENIVVAEKGGTR